MSLHPELDELIRKLDALDGRAVMLERDQDELDRMVKEALERRIQKVLSP